MFSIIITLFYLLFIIALLLFLILLIAVGVSSIYLQAKVVYKIFKTFFASCFKLFTKITLAIKVVIKHMKRFFK